MWARTSRVAAVDVGTNTIRLLVARINEQHVIHVEHSDREMTRLGEGLAHTGRIADVAVERSLAVLGRFSEKIRELAPDGVAVAATSAVREAENGPQFAERVRAETGLDLNVIPGDEEARLTALGASSVLNGDTRNLLIVDIGGGSTEFILIKGGEQAARVSVPMGVVTATERFLEGDPPRQPELYDLDEFLRKHMRTVREGLGELGNVRLVATAGTPTTLAAMDQEMTVYDPARINNHVLPLLRVEELYARIARASIAERARMTGIESGREELMVSGCAILLRVMHDFQFGAVSVSDYGLREGLAIDLFERLGRSV